MDQNIVRRTQNSTWHTQGKTDFQPGWNRAVQLKNNAAGRDIPGNSGNLITSGGQDDGQ